MKCFLLAGQSNMAGRGDIGEVEKICNPRIFMLKYNSFEIMEEPMHTDSKSAGIGPAASFALEYVNEYNEPIGLIPCAHGGTSITQWQPGGELFENMINKASLIGENDEIVGILWAQGETDARLIDNVDEYVMLFDNMLFELEKRLGLKDVPFILADVAPYFFQKPMYPYTGIISDAIKRIASRDKKFGLVETNGLVSQEDGLHYNSKSYRIFGKRFFEVYKNIVGL